MFSLLGSLSRNRRLLKDFVARDLKARYVGSSMGFFWSVVFPIINLFVYMFVFRLVLNARWSDQQGATEVALVMLGGIVVWAAFAETVSRATNSLVENANLIQKVVFPSELLPAYLTISSLINMCIGLPVVLLSVLWFAYLSPPDVHFFDHRDPATIDGPLAHQAGELGGPTIVRVALTRGDRQDISVPFTVGGTATLGEDYTIDASPLAIPSGKLLSVITITPISDEIAEGRESVELTLGEPTNANLGGGVGPLTHTIWIADGISDGALPGPSPPPKGEPLYQPLSLGVTIFFLPVLFLLQIVFTVGLAYFLATLNLFLRDTFHLVGVFITVWMFGTPIFYPAHMVMKARDGAFAWLLEINPMYWLIESYRAVMLFGVWPDWMLLLKLGIVSVLMLAAGSSFFMAQKHRFPDLL